MKAVAEALLVVGALACFSACQMHQNWLDEKKHEFNVAHNITVDGWGNEKPACPK